MQAITGSATAWSLGTTGNSNTQTQFGNNLGKAAGSWGRGLSNPPAVFWEPGNRKFWAPILPCLLEGGINCLFPFEVMGCAHPGELLDAYDGQLRIMGGVDKIQLASGRAAIRKYLDSLVPYVERGGYIPFCDHRCPPDVPEEDYLFYLDLKERMFGLKAQA